MPRYRYRYACGHSSPVTDRESWPAVVECDKCMGRVSVEGRKRLKDTARMPSETRRGRDLAAKGSHNTEPHGNKRKWGV
jgi:hypothetical protein